MYINPKPQRTNNMVDGSTSYYWHYLEPDEDTNTEYQQDEEDLRILKHQMECKEKADSLYGGYFI